MTSRVVTVHVPRACPVDGRAYAEFRALGDFESSPPPRGHLLSAVGEPLSEIDDRARAVLASVSEGGRSWGGVGSVPPSGAIDLLVLPALSSCALSAPIDRRAGAMLTPIAGAHVLIAGGSGDPTPRTIVLDLATGEVAPVGTGLLRQRTRASVTAFDDGALVAGGVGDDGTVLAGAEVYRPSLGGFDHQGPIELGEPRADHGAVVLTSGETLLVGGVGADGRAPLASMEIVDPRGPAVRTEGIARLAVARRSPVVVRLASGEVLVAGGVDVDGAPVAAIEWFAADASVPTKRTRDLVTGAGRAFAALEGGGALAVVAPAAGAPARFQNVWVIDADGAFEPAARVDGALTAPVLFGAAGGAPVLWTGDRWLRWQPWVGAFGALGVLDAAPASVGDATSSPETGLAVWIAADTTALTALRFDLRGSYSPLSRPLLVDDASDLAPDRLPAPGVLAFDAPSGLLLGPEASAFVTDRTYADVAIDVEAPTGEPALVVLRDGAGDELTIGGDECPGAATPGLESAHVVRRGPRVEWTAPGTTGGVCATGVPADARVSVGLRAPTLVARSVVRNLRVTRLGTP